MCAACRIRCTVKGGMLMLRSRRPMVVLLPVCHVALLQLPVIAGVMPIQSLSSFKLIVESSHAAVPDDVRHTRAAQQPTCSAAEHGWTSRPGNRQRAVWFETTGCPAQPSPAQPSPAQPSPAQPCSTYRAGIHLSPSDHLESQILSVPSCPAVINVCRCGRSAAGAPTSTGQNRTQRSGTVSAGKRCRTCVPLPGVACPGDSLTRATWPSQHPTSSRS